eukprot:2039310-Rhodomonas_salina.2
MLAANHVWTEPGAAAVENHASAVSGLNDESACEEGAKGSSRVACGAPPQVAVLKGSMGTPSTRSSVTSRSISTLIDMH